MATPAIRVEGLSKQYAIGARAPGSQTFREMIVAAGTKCVAMNA